MSIDSSFSLHGYDASSVSVKQLLEIVNRLKSSTSTKEIIEILRFFHSFSVCGKDSTTHILESGIIPILSNFLFLNDENVKVEVISLLSVLTLKNGNFNKALVSETAILMFSNLLETVGDVFAIQVIEGISQQFQLVSGLSKPFSVSPNLVMKLLNMLKSKDVTDSVKMNILSVVLNIANTDTSIKGDDDEDGSSSSSFSTSERPLSLKKSLAKLGVAIVPLMKSQNITLAALSRGCVQILEEKYGENFLQATEDEGGVVKYQFEPDSSGTVTLSGDTCVFNRTGSGYTVFLNLSFSDNIYKIDVKVLSKPSSCNVYIGFCASSNKGSISHLTQKAGAGSGCIYFTSNNTRIFTSGNNNNGVDYFSSYPIQVDSTISCFIAKNEFIIIFFLCAHSCYIPFLSALFFLFANMFVSGTEHESPHFAFLCQ